MQHGSFHFHESVFSHKTANRRNSGCTGLECATCFVVHDQIDIALAIFDFLIGQTVKFVRKRAYRFGDQTQGCDTDRQFTGFCLEKRSFRTEDIADVVTFERIVCFLADGIV